MRTNSSDVPYVSALSRNKYFSLSGLAYGSAKTIFAILIYKKLIDIEHSLFSNASYCDFPPAYG